MTDNFSRLPVELLEKVLRRLPVVSLKEARLTCKHWAAVGARYLFHRVFFAPRQEVIDDFMKITGNKAFASNIEELVYDARLFWSYLDGHGTFVRYGGCDLLKATKPTDAARKYSTLLRKQNSIFNAREDLKALRSGLQQLPNLKRVTIVDLSEYFLDYHHFHWDPHEMECFRRWLWKTSKDTAWPAEWSWADYLDGGIRKKESPWDFRGIQNLLTAIEEEAPQLHYLSLGSQRAPLSATIFRQEETAKALRNATSQLISFKMHCNVPTVQEKLQALDNVGAATCIIKGSKNLTDLSLTLDGSLTDWASFHHETRLARLKILDLCEGDIDSQALQAIFDAHGETLRELRLREMHLKDGLPWEEVSVELGQYLQLHCLVLMSISDQFGILAGAKTEQDDFRAVDTAFRLMQQTPHQVQKIGCAGTGHVIAWNTQEFTPSFDLDSYCDHFFSREDILDSYDDDFYSRDDVW